MRKEVERQVFHMLYGIGIIALVTKLGNLGMILLAFFLLFCLFMSIIYHTFHIGVVRFFIERFGRIKETEGFPGKGGIIFGATALLVLFVFPQPIALAAIAICALGDSLSHLYGRYYGVTPNPLSEEKKLDGTVVGVFAGLIGALFFVPFLQALIGSLVAMIIESWDWVHTYLDDNFTVITTASVTIFLLQYFF